ncbi:SLC13 family permease [Magnetococcus sp. PR-3]|uniref:SLC13 family permease n=1 Tax=Magnetococcus sp. PR-3 TaxID=3120355 RepID=UPI002FCE30B1
MNFDMVMVFGLLGVTVVLFASDRIRLDLVAIGVMLALAMTGLVTPQEALAGFGNPVVVLIAALFVIGEGLFKTGVAFDAGHTLMATAGHHPVRLTLLLMVAVALLSAFMSSTGAVAIFMPVALGLARQVDMAPSKLLIPMAFGALIGGMLTLIGTPPNMVVSQALIDAGMDPFGFFEFTPIGLTVLLVAIFYMVLVGGMLLPDRRVGRGSEEAQRQSRRELAEGYQVRGRMKRLLVQPGSALIGQSVSEVHFRTHYRCTLMGIERAGRFSHKKIIPALACTPLLEGDTLFIVCNNPNNLARVQTEQGLLPLPLDEKLIGQIARELGIAEVLIPPGSRLNGQSLADIRFRKRYGLSVLGVKRLGAPLPAPDSETRLKAGDAMLVGGSWKQIQLLHARGQDFMLMSLPKEIEEVAPSRDRAWLALSIVAVMMVVLTFKLLPTVVAVLLAALIMVLSQCLSMEEAYHAVRWESLVLIAGMLPMATALQKSGGADLMVQGLLNGVGGYGPLALMAGLFFLTTLFSQFISNTATTVLIAPIAIGTAQGLDVSAYPLLMAVAIAASTAFATPVASPVNTLVLGPGNYRFNDFVKIGVPLQLLVMMITLIAVPWMFPF